MRKFVSKKNTTVSFLVVMILFFPFFLFPDDFYFTDQLNIPDSSDIREGLIDTWFEVPLTYVRMNNAELRENVYGSKFQIHLEENNSSFAVFVSPETTINIDVYTASGKKTVPSKVYPGDAPGSWVLVRDKKTGVPLHIRYYFMPDSDIFVQFNPGEGENRTTADMKIFNCYVGKGIPLGIPFKTFYTASFKQIYNFTKTVLPWQDVAVYSGIYHASQQMVAVIRENLSDIVYSPDAMYDEKGIPVFISSGKQREIEQKGAGKLSLSSAGFVKWVVDGLVEPLTGSYIRREPLLQPTVEYKQTGFQGIMSSKYRISFTLDWTRNLAAAEFSVRMKKTYKYDDSAVDVTIEPFAADADEPGFGNMTGYIKNTGYAVKYITPLLYVLAATEPVYCYLGAVRQTDTSTTPEVKVFNECAVFFPYFDSTGRFKCTVFENGKETTLEDFAAKYRGDFVHFTRVQASDIFSPQTAGSGSFQ